MIQKFTILFPLLLFALSFANGQDSKAAKKQRSGIAAIPMLNYNRTQGIQELSANWGCNTADRILLNRWRSFY